VRVSAHSNTSRSAGDTDPDPAETREWVQSLESVISEAGTDRALFLLDELEEQLRRKGVRASVQPYSAYRNTIPVDRQGPAVLVLPNAWDAGTARLIESLGAKAIATTSAGLAWSRGYPDGNALPIDQLIAATRDIARVIRVPLTVDIEAGYSADPRAVAELVVRILDIGVVGINIEDGAASADLLCKKIAAVREKVARSGVDLFINTRTDVYLRGIASGDAAIEEVIHRASRYRATGCDGLFVPGLPDGDAMAAIAEAIKPMGRKGADTLSG
jgi:2-methylisocitrate lyase-like PEP mutase family enzyme